MFNCYQSMKVQFVCCFLLYALVCSSQNGEIVGHGDPRDSYFGAQDTMMSSRMVRARNLIGVFDNGSIEKVVLERRIFNKDGGIDSIIGGEDVLNGKISFIQAYSRIVKDGDTILECTNRYITPGRTGDWRKYYYLYEGEGSNMVLRWSRNSDGDVIFKIRYHFFKKGGLRKRVYDYNGTLVLDTIMMARKKWAQDSINIMGGVFRERFDSLQGLKVLYKTYYMDKRVIEDSLFVIGNNGTRRFAQRMLFIYNKAGELVRELTLDAKGVLLREKRTCFDQQSSNGCRYEEEDFKAMTLHVYRRDGQVKEVVFNDDPSNGARKHLYEYDQAGLLKAKSFFYREKLVSKMEFTYEFFDSN